MFKILVNSALQLPCCSLAVVGWCLCWVGAEGWGLLPPCSWCCRTDGLCLWELQCAALLSIAFVQTHLPAAPKHFLGWPKSALSKDRGAKSERNWRMLTACSVGAAHSLCPRAHVCVQQKLSPPEVPAKALLLVPGSSS